MRIFFLIAFIISFSAPIHAQNFFTISGRVSNASSGEPLSNASVYAQNSTFGTVSDESGNYKLSLPNGGYDIVFSYTDKQTESIRVTSGDNNRRFDIMLKDKEKELVAVAVVSSSEVKDGWQKYGSFFSDNFIGRSVHSLHASITNPEKLKFYYSKRRNKLKVLASEPLQIVNKDLGYTIKYELDSFVYDYGNDACIYTGFPFFTAMQPTDSAENARWIKNRDDAFYGSSLHFMRSLFNKRIDEDGFEISFLEDEKQVMLEDPYQALNYIKDDSAHTVSIRAASPVLGIVYSDAKPDTMYTKLHPKEPSKFQFSFINLLTGGITIEQNGYFYDQADVTFNGYWNWDKIGEMLPYDYMPTEVADEVEAMPVNNVQESAKDKVE